LFAYTVSVWNLPETRLCDYTLRCKGCGENIPAPVLTMPGTWIVAECTLCGFATACREHPTRLD